MRRISLSLACVVTTLLAAEARADDEPTADQIKVAKAAFEKLGGAYNTRQTLDKKKTIHVFFLPGGTTDDALKKVPEVPFPFELNLGSLRVTDKGLKPLTGLKTMHTLVLADSLITDASVQIFKDAGMVHALRVAERAGGGFAPRPTTDADVERLVLDATRVTPKGLKELAALDGVSQLFINGAQVSAESLKAFKNLKSLALLKALVTDAKLKEIKGLTDLTVLNLTDSKVTDKGLKEIQGFKKLTELHLNNTPITDAGLKELAGFDDLAHLDLTRTAVTDKGLAELKALKALKVLDVTNTRVTDNGVKNLNAALPGCRVFK